MADSRLVVARAIEALPRRSLRVPLSTVERLDALLPLRMQLEGEATRLGALHGGPGLAAAIADIARDMRAMVPRQDTKTYLRLNQQFHFAIYRECGNDDLVAVIELLWMRHGPLMNIVRSGVLSKTGQFRHAEVIEGVRAGDPEKARAGICGDIADAADAIRARIASAGDGNPGSWITRSGSPGTAGRGRRRRWCCDPRSAPRPPGWGGCR